MPRLFLASTFCTLDLPNKSPQFANSPSYYPPSFNEKWARKKTRRQVIRDFDYIGLILFSGGLLVFLMGVSWGGSYYAWKSVHVITTIVGRILYPSGLRTL